MPSWFAEEHEVDRWCRLLGDFGIPAVRTELRLAVPSRPPPPAAVGATLIHPGAAAASRRWPPERWAEVARSEIAAGHQVAITAGPDERELAESVASMAGLGSDVIVAGDLLTVAAAVAAARVVVCGDTGVAHLASAFATRSCVLFGPTPPKLWGPISKQRHVSLWAGRRGDPHATSTDSGLLAITPEQVRTALASLGERSLS
jgi:ADP-heptose:LPS heptosyltransferase